MTCTCQSRTFARVKGRDQALPVHAKQANRGEGLESRLHPFLFSTLDGDERKHIY